ncbi:MAG TPA: undecaprenyl-diphosphate phosphatase [Gemmatimonadales bacterium]|jgi:undecaprenyl-diphosphatase|nr:undecaprenyl-diphosphate phosphatase [Gemmatimonadales bacterium]
MTLWQGILLGLVQGLTEFLPVSSDGHLAVIGHVAGVHTPGVFVEVALHVATLGSILVVYGRRFWDLALGVLRRRPDALRYAGLLIIGMIPAGLVGVFLEHLIERAFDSLWAAGVGFLVTGALLWSTRWRSADPAAPAAKTEPTPGGALIIGIAQAFAPLPGVSRSGTTIASGLWVGLGPVAAADFSFLMAIPLIAGAGLLEARHASVDIAQVGAVPLAVGCLVAFVSGVFAIRFLVAMLRRGRFYAFAPYCFAIGLFTLAWALWHG